MKPKFKFPKVNDRVLWSDPDNGTCSGTGVVVSIDKYTTIPTDLEQGEVWPNSDSIYAIKKDDGGEVECTANELSLV